MAKQNDEEVAVDGFGRPLPLVKLVDKAGNVHEVREAGGLSTLHYGQGMGFAEDGMTYADALAVMLGEGQQSLALVTDEGDVVQPEPPAEVTEDDDKDSAPKASGGKKSGGKSD